MLAAPVDPELVATHFDDVIRDGGEDRPPGRLLGRDQGHVPLAKAVRTHTGGGAPDSAPYHLSVSMLRMSQPRSWAVSSISTRASRSAPPVPW